MRVLCRRTTPDDFGRNRWADISIHVLRVEDDLHCVQAFGGHSYFNPRPPCGGRQGQDVRDIIDAIISIHVLRVEDDRTAHGGSAAAAGISIHVLRVEDDPGFVEHHEMWHIFQSTSSVWRTTCHRDQRLQAGSDFNPRPPCGGRLTDSV